MLCRPDADILVPVFSPYGRSGIISPFAVERNISLLMRFDYPLTDGKSLVAHHGHRIRKELIDFWEDNKLEGSDLGLRSTKVCLKYCLHVAGSFSSPKVSIISAGHGVSVRRHNCQE